MVVIRLVRVGKKNDPRYRITVADSRRWLNGKFIEVLGHYNPRPSANEKGFVMNTEKYQAWVSKGAQPSDRVRSLVRKAQA
jgi:small subunit ribosomal protein S16